MDIGWPVTRVAVRVSYGPTGGWIPRWAAVVSFGGPWRGAPADPQTRGPAARLAGRSAAQALPVRPIKEGTGCLRSAAACGRLSSAAPLSSSRPSRGRSLRSCWSWLPPIVTAAERGSLSRALVAQGCRYAVCTGAGASAGMRRSTTRLSWRNSSGSGQVIVSPACMAR